MENRAKLVVAKNALANVVRGGAAALMAILVPPFLTRLLSPDAFGVWSLILQISAYVGYLDFGIQTAVGRFVAYAHESGDVQHRDRIVSTSLATLGAAGLLAILGLGIVSACITRLFPQMPRALLSDARLALMLVGCSLAVGLPASIFGGIFIGLQRNEVPAAIIGGSRIVSAALVIFVADRGGSLMQMALVLTAINLASYLVQYLMYRRISSDIRLSPQLVGWRIWRELFDYCGSLTIWSLAMLLISGLDLTLVGYFQFEAVAYYSVAAILVTFIAGMQNAVFNALIPASAVLHARGESGQLGRMMITATRYGSILLLLTGLPLIFEGKWLLALWVGRSYAGQADVFLKVLVLANIIRLSATPYVVTLIGTGEQRRVTVTPILEGLSNFVLSVILGFRLGAIGVALGTLFGSFVGVSGNWLYNMHRTRSIAFKIADYMRDGLLRPLVCFVPAGIYAIALFGFPRANTNSTALTGVFALLASLGCLWRWGLSDGEREKLNPRSLLRLAIRGFDVRR